jgi:transcriptional regulator
MFVPGQYRAPDRRWAIDLMRRNPLALMISHSDRADIPEATHLPIIFDPAWPAGPDDDTGELRLIGHMNRANPHWKGMADEAQVKIIFAGAHGYVSPTVYDVTPAAPTWNFTAVHVHGTLRKLDAGEPTLAAVMATVAAYEARFGADWDMAPSVDYFRRILPGVGAFRIQVTALQSMFKLSQEQQPHIRDRVTTSFAASESSRHRDVAELMRQLPRRDRSATAARSCPAGGTPAAR